MQFHTLALLGLVAVTSAWLPGVNKAITALDGQSLFQSNGTNTTVPVAGRRSFKRWLPSLTPIRGVNLGSLFIVEPWMAMTEWESMGCTGYNSEFDCVNGIGQDAANTAFQNHWNTWITENDIATMVSYGLNTIRIPVGYWMREDIVYADSEHFPQGGLQYLEQVCGWASDHGLYIIIDLHGAPGAQVVNNSDTGQFASEVGFYVDYQFERALQFLEWMTTLVHTTTAFRNVGMLEIVNEPLRDPTQVGTMLSTYYPNAFTRIRAAESALGNITANNELHIQMMNTKWGSGTPEQYLTDDYFAAYDDHRYVKYDSSVPLTHDGYIQSSCNDDRGGDSPTIVGEWSLSPSPENDTDWLANSDNAAFYTQWFEAQVHAYEKQLGWIFWSWKTSLNDYRWAYSGMFFLAPSSRETVYPRGLEKPKTKY
ncbi:MAG: hypothetical protein M1818_003297 [Claussenomyces sp. TS43310]|nr:MAG: hypothetical protein M1818_003297 [Claussenomyces sp. TS43310]